MKISVFLPLRAPQSSDGFGHKQAKMHSVQTSCPPVCRGFGFWCVSCFVLERFFVCLFVWGVWGGSNIRKATGKNRKIHLSPLHFKKRCLIKSSREYKKEWTRYRKEKQQDIGHRVYPTPTSCGCVAGLGSCCLDLHCKISWALKQSFWEQLEPSNHAQFPGLICLRMYSFSNTGTADPSGPSIRMW